MAQHWSDEQEDKIKSLVAYYTQCRAYTIKELGNCGMSTDDAEDELLVAAALMQVDTVTRGCTLQGLNESLDYSYDGFYVANKSEQHSGIDIYNSLGDYIESFDNTIEAYYALCN